MSDYNDAEPFAAAGSGKSPEEVAYDLVAKLKGQGVWGEKNQAAILDMYAECLDATRGLRAYEGQKRVQVPVHTPDAKPAAQTAPAQPAQSVQQAAPIQAQPQPQQPVQPQLQQPQQAAPAPHQAQAMLNQAFNRG